MPLSWLLLFFLFMLVFFSFYLFMNFYFFFVSKKSESVKKYFLSIPW